MIFLLRALVICALACAAAPAQKSLSDTEEKDLREAIAESNNSPLDLARSLEKHLKRYPDSPQKTEIESELVKAAIQARDDRRTLEYGERILSRNNDSPQILERVARILMTREDKESSEKALAYARRFEQVLRALEKEGPSTERNRGQLLDELDRALGRSLIFQARAKGNLGKLDEAVDLAAKAFGLFPNAESAREAGRWHAKAGNLAEALKWYADAFIVMDSKNAPSDQAKDRERLKELYVKLRGAEQGLGDIVLQAYDRTAALAEKRAELQRERDPNSTARDAMDWTLSSLKGEKFKLASLRGKILVLDFWATWCGPCRVQHPLYDQVKQRFQDQPDVVFIAISTDEDRSLVGPFLEANQWSKNVYFEDGLGQFLKVSSIPTTIVIDRQGRISSRMNGFLPDRFVNQLISRIEEALTEK